MVGVTRLSLTEGHSHGRCEGPRPGRPKCRPIRHISGSGGFDYWPDRGAVGETGGESG